MGQEQNSYPRSNGATSENQPMAVLSQSQQSQGASQIHSDTQPQVNSEVKSPPLDKPSLLEGLFIVKFAGRMRRRDFLLSLLLLMSAFLIGVAVGLVELLFSFVYEMGFDEGRDDVILSLFGSYLGLVMLGMAVRRLHDAGRSGWLLLLCFLPFVGILCFLPYTGILIGVILLVIMCCKDSQREPNRWGPNPKGVLCEEGSRSENHTVNEQDIATQEGKKCEQPSGVSGVRKCINVIGGFMIMVAIMLLMHRGDIRGFIADINSCFGIDDDAVEAHRLMWQVEQGLKYYEGLRGTRQDRIAAEKLICEAFDKGVEEQTRQWGDACAKGLLGICYDMGIGVEQDGAKATYWYDQARAADIFFFPRAYPHASYILDTRDNSVSVGAKEKAARWYRMAQRGKRKAAKEGNVYAMYELGKCYLDGIGVERNGVQAVEWFKKAADRGNKSAMYELGKCYLEGTGVDKDAAQAVEWFKKASDAGDTYAMYELGKCYLEGTGVDKDAAQAVEWFKKAANNENRDAMFKLGKCYLDGIGVERNGVQAVEWFKKAADRGNKSAMYALGKCYHEGIGVYRDEQQAEQWFQKAAWSDLMQKDHSDN